MNLGEALRMSRTRSLRAGAGDAEATVDLLRGPGQYIPNVRRPSCWDFVI